MLNELSYNSHRENNWKVSLKDFIRVPNAIKEMEIKQKFVLLAKDCNKYHVFYVLRIFLHRMCISYAFKSNYPRIHKQPVYDNKSWSRDNY